MRRYLDHAQESKLLCSFLDRGTRIHGILAIVEPCELKTGDADISTHIVDKKHTIAVLKRLRRQRER